MSNTSQAKPKTRQELASILGISTKTLTRFLKKEGITVEPRALLKPKLVAFILQKYREE